MSATPKQIKLIEDLQEVGAPISSKDGGDPDFSMFDSVQQADAYIKLHYHLLAKKASIEATSKRICPSEWGGIPNH